MRKINKQTPLENFNGDRYKDCSDWSCFHDKYKDRYEEARLTILIDEQKCLCGYTEIYIDNEKNGHIDHFVKRSINQNLTFDWNNLIVATKDDDFGANFKDNKYNSNGIQESEYNEIFNPVNDDVKFKYTEWGEIITEEEKVRKTVEVFNLNHESLKRRRKNLITTIIALKQENSLSSEEIKNKLDTLGFSSVIEYLLEDG
jgi:uncharacterized protein (TIGR02646 family)